MVRQLSADVPRRSLSSPVAPNVLPVANSHMPASSWQSPPTPRAIPTTAFGYAKSERGIQSKHGFKRTTVMPRAPALYNDRIKVVEAKPKRPRGAGLPSLRW